MSSEPYFTDGTFTLYHGDCIRILGEFPEESVDLIFADPPYNLSNGGFTCQAGRRAPVDKGEWDISFGIEEDFCFHDRWIRECRRVLRASGSIWISGTYHSIYSCGFALQKNGFHILNDICWYKPNAPPNLSTRYFTASHETLIWARKDRHSRHTFNYRLLKTGDWPEDGLKKEGRQMRTVWSIPSPRGLEKKYGSHPTQKPCSLLKRIILGSSRDGDLVLDPFTGSSTTGIAACATGRRFIGIDTEPQFLDLSLARYRDLIRSRTGDARSVEPGCEDDGVT
ncbi:MAG: site-specific DNA-methyltransferase [Methanomicrobiales archaeon]|nr:site-specific DNA-methyltransferase [Methanomicrobiales archaeon]